MADMVYQQTDKEEQKAINMKSRPKIVQVKWPLKTVVRRDQTEYWKLKKCAKITLKRLPKSL